MQVLDFFLLMQVAAAGGEGNIPSPRHCSSTLCFTGRVETQVQGVSLTADGLTEERHEGKWSPPRGGNHRVWDHIHLHSCIFPLLAARQAAEQEKEVREGAEGNLFPVSLLQAAVVGLGGGWGAGVGTIKALSGKSCCFICLQEWTNHGSVSMNQIPSLWKCSAKLEILGCTTPRT